MAEISAAAVMKLRQMSGQGMMDCKKALGESDGDMDKAMGILRKKGLATLEKRASRETSEGIVVSTTSDDGKIAILATLCCETDFVAKNDDFIKTAETLSKCAMLCTAEEGTGNVLDTEIDGKKFNDILTELVSKTGEKTQVGNYTKYTINGSGLIFTYIHFNKKIGTMIELAASEDSVASSEDVKAMASDVAMHITATNPMAMDKSGIDSKTIEKEKEIFAEQVKNKPENIIEKIVEGKMNKFFAENCLLDQPFVKDDSKTVGEIITDAGKKAGGEITLKRFVRFSVG